MARVGTRNIMRGLKMENCPFNVCDGSGWHFVREKNACVSCRCLQLRIRQKRTEKLFARSGIPARYKNKTFDNFEPGSLRMQYEIVKRYGEKFFELKGSEKNGLCLVGPVGTGKTHLVYALLNYLIKEKNVQVVAGNMPELLDSLRPGRGESAERQRAEQRMELLKTAELVFLDDLKAERDSDWAAERIYIMINYRYNELLPTVISTNVEPEQMGADGRLAWQRIGSRLFEMCHLVLVDEEDYRKKL